MLFMNKTLLLSAMAVSIACSTIAEAQQISNFRLLDQHGVSHELHRQSERSAVLLITTSLDDPAFARHLEFVTTLLTEAPEWKAWFIAAEGHEHRAAYVERFQEVNVDTSVLLDEANIVLHMLGATDTGVAYVIDPESWRIRYEGPLASGAAEHLNALLAAEIDSVDGQAESVALPLAQWPENVSYTEHIAPILAEKCATCHRQGDVGPFAFDGYRRAAGWAAMVREVVMTRRMPPWDADPVHGEFENDRGLSAEDTRNLAAWAGSGAPRGEGDDILSDLPAADPDAWHLGEPDKVLAMETPFEIPADGIIEYQLFRVSADLDEDRWLKGVEVRPGNRRVLHHCLIFIEYPEHLKHMEPSVSGGARGFFAGFVPGAEPRFYPEDTGKFVPAGSTFLFQMHYVTSGREESDQTQMALYFHDDPPKLQLETTAAFNADFEIPPFAENHEVRAQHGLRGMMTLYSMSPHMHYRGKSFKYVAEYPSGAQEVLLSVPNYQFDWQINYALATPKTMPPGTTIRAIGSFDNSTTNPYNPDPSKPVHFGDQTYEEMFIGYMDMAAPPQFFIAQAEARKERMERARNQSEVVADGPDLTPEELIGTKWREGDWRFEFLEDNVFLVNGLIRGKYRIENKQIFIDVVGEYFELDIIGSGLYFNRSYAMERLD